MEQLNNIYKSIHNIEKTLATMEVDVRHHIKRTDMLESKVQKIWYLVVLGAGAGLAEWGPSILKILGVL